MSDIALELIDVRKHFGKTAVLRGASLRVTRGERLALIGPNGAGKSTLFNLVSGLFAPDAGDILLNGVSIAGKRAFEIHRAGMARSFQITSIFHRLSVRENLRCALLWPLGYRYSFWHRLNGLRDLNRRADAMLEQIGLRHRRDVPAGLLSYAEQRALEIGIAAAGDADVLLLDEPTAGMSRAESDAAVALIRSLSAGKTLLMVEHDMDVVFGLADRVAVLADGMVIACDTPDRVRADHRVQLVYLGERPGGHMPEEA